MVFGDGSSMYVLCTDDVNDRNHPDEDDNTFSLTRNTEEEKKNGNRHKMTDLPLSV